MFQMKKLAGAVLTFSVILSGCDGSDSDDDEVVPVAFSFTEATIESLHTSLATGGITCEEVVEGYIERINTYDDEGTDVELNSVIAINSSALDEARAKDLAFEDDGIDGSLYCVPVLPKDNFNTAEMPTTGGALAFQYNRPVSDAYTIGKMRDAGAIVLGKANMDEFAFGYTGESSVRGLVKNAYDQTKGAGGSSSGTGAAIASSLAMVGTGSDTGGSIRVPASLGGLVGIRPSMRLVSQDGIMPLASWQDTGGPICRTVEDCALMMDVMVGFDDSEYANQRVSFEIDAAAISSEEEYLSVTGVPETYTDYLDADGLNGARIAIDRDLFGDNENVNALMDSAIAAMEAAGATVEEVTIDNLESILYDYASMSSYEFQHDLVSYLNSWTTSVDGHITTYQGLIDSNGYLENYKSSLEYRGTIDLDNLTDEQQEVYTLNTVERPVVVRTSLLKALNNVDDEGNSLGEAYDVLLYPSLTGEAGDLGGSPSAGRNNRLSPFSLFPALSMPAGMTDDDPAMPIGMEMLGREFDEATLIKLAYSYQEQVNPRQAPVNTPELTTEQ
ncbi:MULTISPECIES: amidase [unclassified Oceanobacter]|uniref:amidase n=1 Tax=unclassified Oceanobacter TaxID=2620260 RepID=UPI0026E23AF6|nr:MULTISPECIES: amidase family protein [unclassified Oceanobacter]MDO6682013.1 amidase family protein [Oceanobacter sp. 5_MG-2023]MDP2548049.1 amidase family protein [Oceanobacter sp. 4_MG-2023]